MGFGVNVDETVNSLALALYEHTFESSVMEAYLYVPSGADTSFYPADFEQKISLYSPYVSDNLPNKFIIIRSTARSNIVSEDGKREGVLLSIPITKASTELYQTHSEDQILFASKDTL